MGELFEGVRIGAAKRVGEFAVIATMAATAYLVVHWLDDRIDDRLDDRLPGLESQISGCATAAECERRGAEIDGLRVALGEALRRVDTLERYVDRHDATSDLYKRKIDVCCDTGPANGRLR